MAPRYCREALQPADRFDKRSFRHKRVGKRDHLLLVACPKGSWDQEGQSCTAAMQVKAILHPISEGKCKHGDFKSSSYPLEGFDFRGHLRRGLVSGRQAISRVRKQLPPWAPWVVLGAGAVFLIFGFSRKAEASTMSVLMGRTWTDEDAEYLARVLIMETGFGRNLEEMKGVAWSAVNRAIKNKTSIKKVTAILSWPGPGARGQSFVAAMQMDQPGRSAMHDAPVGHQNIIKAREFTKNLLMGKVSNPVGNRTNFCHPSGMPASDQPDGVKNAKGNRISKNGRWLPLWAVNRSQGGMVDDALLVGGAIFSRPG